MFQLYGVMYLLETRMYAATKFGESDDITLNRCYSRRLYDVIAIRLFFLLLLRASVQEID